MGWDTPDVYHQPEKFGLTLVGSVSWSDEAYKFDYTIVLVDGNNTLYWADDSGCSCPSPFDRFTSIESLTTGSRDAILSHLNQRCLTVESNARPDEDGWSSATVPDGLRDSVSRLVERLFSVRKGIQS